MAANSDFLFGIRPVIEAVKSGKEIDRVLIKKGSRGELYEELIKILKENNIQWKFVPVDRINRATRKNHQGVIAFVSAISYANLEDTLMTVFENGKVPLVLVLDGITDIRNMGAIARSAECAGVDIIVIPEKGGAPINADAVKTSAGALYNIPVARVKNLYRAIDYLKDAGLKIIAATEKTNSNYTEVDFNCPAAIVLGAEDTGVSESILNKADDKAKIPIMGNISSLNVSVAAGILVYEAVRQRV